MERYTKVMTTKRCESCSRGKGLVWQFRKFVLRPSGNCIELFPIKPSGSAIWKRHTISRTKFRADRGTSSVRIRWLLLVILGNLKWQLLEL